MAEKKQPKRKITNGTPAEASLYDRFWLQIQHLPTKKSVYFKAILTQFEDQYVSDWNTEQVFGRMDPIKTFRGTQRTITLGWDVVAASLDEARDNLSECSTLLAMLYPAYEGGPKNPNNVSDGEQTQTTSGSALTRTQENAQ